MNYYPHTDYFGLYGVSYQMSKARTIVPPPLGYRWLEVGEASAIGDWICDLRCHPVPIRYLPAHKLCEYNHLTARKLDEHSPDDLTMQEIFIL